MAVDRCETESRSPFDSASCVLHASSVFKEAEEEISFPLFSFDFFFILCLRWQTEHERHGVRRGKRKAEVSEYTERSTNDREFLNFEEMLFSAFPFSLFFAAALLVLFPCYSLTTGYSSVPFAPCVFSCPIPSHCEARCSEPADTVTQSLFIELTGTNCSALSPLLLFCFFFLSLSLSLLRFPSQISFPAFSLCSPFHAALLLSLGPCDPTFCCLL